MTKGALIFKLDSHVINIVHMHVIKILVYQKGTVFQILLFLKDFVWLKVSRSNNRDI